MKALIMVPGYWQLTGAPQPAVRSSQYPDRVCAFVISTARRSRANSLSLRWPARQSARQAVLDHLGGDVDVVADE